MLVIADLQSEFSRGQVIGAYYVIELPIYEAGVRYEDEIGFIFRDPEVWCSDRQMARMVGVPILLHDPDGETNVPEYPANCVGTILNAHVEDGKCIAECRIISQTLADYLAIADGLEIEAELVTVPGEDAETFDDDGDTILVEPSPACVSFLTLRLLGDDDRD